MPNVRVDPEGIVISLDPPESLIEAAWRLGYYWPTRCYGQAECTACHIEIVEGEHHASPIGAEEAATLATMGPRGRQVRLACRTTFDGDAAVYKRGVRVAE
ncbi:MAG TPA: 2Fe-2S iron-sulfur cluster-binding protein [Acidimicrobiales bacterium]|jgi:2Fe-2S ferredoxin|nr:2Fe-2S iron-sulfur cluster-binding protein [Acidimicrobiales bacterium]